MLETYEHGLRGTQPGSTPAFVTMRNPGLLAFRLSTREHWFVRLTTGPVVSFDLTGAAPSLSRIPA